MGKIKSNKENILFCHYSGLPSPLAYDADYDGIGNQGRVPIRRPNKKNTFFNKLKKLLKK